MANKLPKKLLRTTYRKQLWKNVNTIVAQVEKVLPISSMHLMGSFTTKKRRPADIDFIVLLQTPKKKSRWSVDLVIAPDNAHGKAVLEDCKKWMRQKYGSKKSVVVQMK